MSSSVHLTETLVFMTLLQLIVMILAARLGNQIARSVGQPGSVGEIVAGLMLGPSLFGLLFPEASTFLFAPDVSITIIVISQIGLVLLMFQIGSDFEFGHLARAKNRNSVIGIASASVSVPFVLGFIIGQVSAPHLAPQTNAFIYSLFFGVALAITALPILGRILREYDLTRTELGVVAISAAALNDVVGWILLAAISAYAVASFTASGMAVQLGGIALLLAVSFLVLRPAVDRLVKRYPVEEGVLPSNIIAIALCLMFALGIATYKLGIFAIFGGFLAGLLFHRHGEFVIAWRKQVGQFVLVFFLPVFFTYTGLRTNIWGLTTASDFQWLAVVLAAAVFGKIVPVYFAARASGFNHNESTILGSLMNTRALMELIVLNIGYDLGFIPQTVFTMLVIMAVVTTVMTGPLLRVFLPRTGRRVPIGIEA
jgi:Kef-type K+ transport system membrane component KefB